VKKLKRLLVWLGITAYLIFVSGFVTDKSNNRVCERVNVTIVDSLTHKFINSGDILDILLENDRRILGYPLRSINTLELEKLLHKESFVKKADIYKTVNGALNVDLVQRKPVLRVINHRGSSYYIDRDGAILPVSEKFTSRVIVANGHIHEPFVLESAKSIFDGDVPVGKRNSVLQDLYELACFINDSRLWSAQIAQVYVNSGFELELIPRVGAHVIYLGDAGNIEAKFSKLEALYFYGLSNTGWNRYEKINLKYENQVVCTKR
jgi:cell division protein FtsQ